MATAAAKKIQVFIGYHAIDEQLKKKLLSHLRVLERLHNITVEHEIEPGSHLGEAIQRQLCAADMILLLLSSDFLGSDEHMRHIVEPAIKKSKAAESVVVPVIMRSCLWKLTELAQMEVLPENGEPLEEYDIKEAGYRNVASEIKHRIEKLKVALRVQELEMENVELRQKIEQLQQR